MKYRNKITGEIREVGTAGNSDMNNIIQQYQSGAFGSPGSTTASRHLEQMKTLGLLKTPEEDKGLANRKSLDKRLGVLEGLWFPNEDKLALPKQTNWVGRQTHKLQKTYEASSEYEQFRRYAKTLGATLAKAAGDTGNIAWAEQANQLQALADADLTKEEAEAMFRSIREGLDVPKTNKNYYNNLRKGKVQTVTPDKKTTIPATTGEETGGGQAGPEFWQRVLNTQQEKIDVPLPNLPYAGAGTAIGGMMKNPALAALIGGGGEWLGQLKEKGIPLTKSAGEEWKGSSAETIGAGARTGGLSMLLHPMQTLGAVRNAALKNAISAGKSLPTTSTIPETGMKFAEGGPKGALPEHMRTARKMAMEDISAYGGKGKFTLPDFLTELTKRGKAAYSPKSGDLLQKSSAAYNAAVRDSLRTLLSDISPTAGAATSAMNKLYQVPRLMSKAKEPVKWLIALATAKWAINSLRGQGGGGGQ